MRPLFIIGLLLAIVGVIAMAVPGVTFFTHERVVDTNYFALDVAKPHTIIFNPVLGAVALAAGVILMLAGERSRTS